MSKPSADKPGTKDPSAANAASSGGPVSSSPVSSSPVSSQVLDQVFHALSHAMRRQILVVLYARGGSMTAGEIADRFRCSWPTTTRHLSVLESAGCLEVTRVGRHRVYRLTSRSLLRSADWIYSWARMTDQANDAAAGVPAEENEKNDADWKQFAYATMRNAIPPGSETQGDQAPAPGTSTGAKTSTAKTTGAKTSNQQARKAPAKKPPKQKTSQQKQEDPPARRSGRSRNVANGVEWSGIASANRAVCSRW